MADRIDIAAFTRAPEAVALLARRDELFSLLNRRLTLPTECCALVWTETAMPALVSAGEDVDGPSVRELLIVRTVPLSLEYSVTSGLRSKDAYEVTASARLIVQVVPERAELMSFRTAVMAAGREVSTKRIEAHCADAVRAALAEFVREHHAADLTAVARVTGIEEVLGQHFQPVGFASGLALGRDIRVAFSSPAFEDACRRTEVERQRARREEENQQRRLAATQARRDHLDEIETLLGRLERLSAERPGVSTMELIKTFDPALRGSLYEGLLALRKPTVRTEAILAIAGDELLWFDPEQPAQLQRRQPLTSRAGPLRSIRLSGTAGDRVILVGARQGVHVLRRDGCLVHLRLYEGGPEPRGGFNASVVEGDTLYATHSEIGLVRWAEPDGDQAPGRMVLGDLTAGAKFVRDIQSDSSGGLWFSVDDRILGWRPRDGSVPSRWQAPGTVTALAVAEGVVLAGLEDGRIVRWRAVDSASGEIIRGPTGRGVQSLDWSPGAGVPRLLAADGLARLELLVVGDTHVGEYRCSQRLRWSWMAEDYVVAVNDRRDQVLVWRFDVPDQPAATIAVGRVCGHPIQDVALLPMAAAR